MVFRGQFARQQSCPLGSAKRHVRFCPQKRIIVSLFERPERHLRRLRAPLFGETFDFLERAVVDTDSKPSLGRPVIATIRHWSSLRSLPRSPKRTSPATHLTFVLGSDAAAGFSMPLIEERTLTLEAAQDIELRPGLVLAPGLYCGTEERIRTDSIGGPSWAIKYKITLPEERLDVTEFVRQGRLIRGPPLRRPTGASTNTRAQVSGRKCQANE